MSGWKTIRLSEFCRTGTGGTPSRSNLERYYMEGTIPWVKSGELRESVITETEEHVTEAALRETNVKLVPAGALLLAMYGATVGRLGILGVQATTNQAVCHIIPDPKVAEVRFLFHALSNQVSNLIARGVGGAQPNISQGIVKDLKLALPPLVEQRRIAEMLDRAEALRAKRRAALAELDSLTQSLFFDLFGDPAHNPKQWPTQPLGQLGDGPGAIVDGPFGSAINVKKDYIDNGEIPVIRTKNVRPFEFITDDLKRISRTKFRGLERSAVIPGDILLTKVGTIGHVCFFPPIFEVAVLSTTGSCRIRPNETLVQRTYLAHFLHLYRKEMLKLVAEGVQPFLNMRHIKSFIVPLPPLELQREFACRVTAVEKLKATHRASLAELDALFATLQHRGFRGEL